MPDQPSATARTAFVLAAVSAERTRQDIQWGGPTHDMRQSATDWRSYRFKFEDRAEQWAERAIRYEDIPAHALKCRAAARAALVAVAALAVAEIECLDRMTGVWDHA